MKTIGVVILVGILIVALLAFIIFDKKLSGEVVSEETYDEDWLNENCDCIERQRLECHYAGYELRGNFCWNGKKFTNPVRKCSIYDCAGEIYEIN